ncbi:MAG: hypothetical protein AAGD10_11755 [Myxococcota bacterium]
MTPPQWTVFIISCLGTILGSLLIYPGVRKRSDAWVNAALASVMTAALTSVALGLFFGALHNGLLSLLAPG